MRVIRGNLIFARVKPSESVPEKVIVDNPKPGKPIKVKKVKKLLK